MQSRNNSRGRLDGKVVLISGGASAPGNLCAGQMIREGATVIAGDDSYTISTESAEFSIRTVNTIHLDVTLERSWQTAFDLTLQVFGRVDVLVNAAGVSFTDDTLEECTADTWERTLAINLDGTFLGCGHAVRAMRPSRRGSIINIASILGLIANGTSIAYTATMAGVRLLTRSVALHCAKERNNIRCNSICPQSAHLPQGTPETADVPIAPDIGGLAIYLASDISGACTGADFVVDNGFTAA